MKYNASESSVPCVTNEQLLVFLARFSLRHGFAACCEEWLRLSVELAFRPGCALVLEESIPVYGTILKSKLLITSKARAQPRGKVRAKRKGTAIPHNRRRSRAEQQWFWLRLFDNTTAVDRREKPSHGYRAFHLVVKYADKLVEIQIRSSLQQLWAELSEKLSDTIDPALKYGGGNPAFLKLLASTSELVTDQELNELRMVNLQTQLQTRLSECPTQGALSELIQQQLSEVNQQVEENVSTGRKVFEALRNAINNL
jgi:hypothetical protein